jgi:hypothetical protein
VWKETVPVIWASRPTRLGRSGFGLAGAGLAGFWAGAAPRTCTAGPGLGASADAAPRVARPKAVARSPVKSQRGKTTIDGRS